MISSPEELLYLAAMEVTKMTCLIISVGLLGQP
jgi:hypothetical protein